jgi:hypothetical protein
MQAFVADYARPQFTMQPPPLAYAGINVAAESPTASSSSAPYYPSMGPPSSRVSASQSDRGTPFSFYRQNNESTVTASLSSSSSKQRVTYGSSQPRTSSQTKKIQSHLVSSQPRTSSQISFQLDPLSSQSQRTSSQTGDLVESIRSSVLAAPSAPSSKLERSTSSKVDSVNDPTTIGFWLRKFPIWHAILLLLFKIIHMHVWAVAFREVTMGELIDWRNQAVAWYLETHSIGLEALREPYLIGV